MNDLIIIGAGPAGLAAAIYAGRYMLKTLIISKNIGGTCLEAHDICNYPGFKKISGQDLMKKFIGQVKSYNIKIIEEEIADIDKIKDIFKIKTKTGKLFETKTIMLCLGTKRRKLNIQGEEDFLGRGVSYCFTCDAPLFKDKIVGVVGGSDAAVMAARLLREYARKVYIIYRKDKLRAEPIRIEQIKKDPKIEIITNTNITKIIGKKFVEEVIFDNKKSLKLDGIFVEIGAIPSTDLAKKLKLKLTKDNYIKVNKDQETNIKGVFAAGDITDNQLKQVVTSAAEGAKAAFSVYKYLQK